VVGLAPEALVDDDHFGRGAGKQIGQRLTLLFVGRHRLVAEGRPALVGEEHQSHSQRSVLGLGVTVTGNPRK